MTQPDTQPQEMEAPSSSYTELISEISTPVVADLDIKKTSALQQNIENKMLSHKKLCIERPEILAQLDFKPAIDTATSVPDDENRQIFEARKTKRRMELQSAVVGLQSAQEADPESYSEATAQYNSALASAAAEISLLKVAYTFKTYASQGVSFSTFCDNYEFDATQFREDPVSVLGYTVEEYMDRTMLSPSGQFEYLIENSADASALLQFLADLSFACCFGCPSTIKPGGDNFPFSSVFTSNEERVNTIINVKQNRSSVTSYIDTAVSGMIRASRDITASVQIGKVALGEGNEDEELKSILLEYLPEDYFSSIDRPEPLKSLYSYFVGWDPYAQSIKDSTFFDPDRKVLYYVPDFKNYKSGIASHIFTSNEVVKVSSNTDEYITSVDVQYNSDGTLEVPDSGLSAKSKEFLGVNKLVNDTFARSPLDFTEYQNEIEPLAKNIKTFATAYKKLFKLLDEKGTARPTGIELINGEHPSSPVSIYVNAQRIFAEKWHANAAAHAGAMLDGNMGYLKSSETSVTAAQWGSKVHQCFAAYYFYQAPDVCKEILRRFIKDYFDGFLTLSGESSTETVAGEEINIRKHTVPGTNSTVDYSSTKSGLYSYLQSLYRDGGTPVTGQNPAQPSDKNSLYGTFKLGRYLRNSEVEPLPSYDAASDPYTEGPDSSSTGSGMTGDTSTGETLTAGDDSSAAARDTSGAYIIKIPLPVYLKAGMFNGARNHNGFSGLDYEVTSGGRSNANTVESELGFGGDVLEQTYGLTEEGGGITRDPLEYSYFFDRLSSEQGADYGTGEDAAYLHYSEPCYEGLIEMQHFYQMCSMSRDGQYVPLAMIPISGHIIDMVMTLLNRVLSEVLEISSDGETFPSNDIHSAPYQNQEFTTSNSMETNYNFGTMPAGYGSLLHSNKDIWVPTLEALRKNCMRPGDKTTWYSSSGLSNLTDNIIDIFTGLARPLGDTFEVHQFGYVDSPLGPGTAWNSIPYKGWEPLTFWESRRSNSYYGGEIVFPTSPQTTEDSLQDKISYAGRCVSAFFCAKSSPSAPFLSRNLSVYYDYVAEYSAPGARDFEDSQSTMTFESEYIEPYNSTPIAEALRYLLNTASGHAFADLNYASKTYESSPFYSITQSSTITFEDIKNYLFLKSIAQLYTGLDENSDSAAYNLIPWGDYINLGAGNYVNFWNYASTDYINEFDRFCENLVQLSDEDKKLSISFDILEKYADRISDYSLKAVDGLTSEDGESALNILINNLSATDRGSWILQNLTPEQLNLKSVALQSIQGDRENGYISKCDIIGDTEAEAIDVMLAAAGGGGDARNMTISTFGLPAGLLSNIQVPAVRYQPEIDGINMGTIPYSPLIYVKVYCKYLNVPQLFVLPKIYRFDTELFVLPGAFDDINFATIADFRDLVLNTKFTRYRYLTSDSSQGVVNYDQVETFTLLEKNESGADSGFSGNSIQDDFDIYSNTLASYLLEKYYEVIVGFAAAEHDFGTAGEGLQLPIEEYATDLASALASIYSDLTTGDDAVGDEIASQIFYSSEQIDQMGYSTLNPELSSITSISNYSSIVEAVTGAGSEIAAGELSPAAQSLFNSFTNAASSNLFSASSMREKIISANYFDRVYMISQDPDDFEILGKSKVQAYYFQNYDQSMPEEAADKYADIIQALRDRDKLDFTPNADLDILSLDDATNDGLVRLKNYPNDSELDKGQISFFRTYIEISKDEDNATKGFSGFYDADGPGADVVYSYSIPEDR